MTTYIIAGIGTDIGKTLVSSILAKILKADYWKPIQAGLVNQDSLTVAKLTDRSVIIHKETYLLKHPLSPHYAAEKENLYIKKHDFIKPSTSNTLLIEMPGGVMVPINKKDLLIDVFKDWDCKWILVVKHYLGCIHHTLSTLEALKAYKVDVAGIIFNGEDIYDAESIILSRSQLTCLARLKTLTHINPSIIQEIANTWKKGPLCKF